VAALDPTPDGGVLPEPEELELPLLERGLVFFLEERLEPPPPEPDFDPESPEPEGDPPRPA
jgi:hypothetical protein